MTELNASNDAIPNMFARLAKAREEFHALELKKSGWNSYSRYKYFELQDFIVPAMKALHSNGLVPIVTYNKDLAIMNVFDLHSNASFQITSPMVKAKYTLADGTVVIQGANLTASHPIQNLGAVETYQRRYLWITLMEVLEHDAIDGTAGDTVDKPTEEKPGSRKVPLARNRKSAPAKQPDPEPDDITFDPEPDGFFDNDYETVRANDEVVMNTEEDAAEVADMLIGLTQGGATDMEILLGMWRNHKKIIDMLDTKYPKQYARVKKVFTETKAKLIQQQEQNDV